MLRHYRPYLSAFHRVPFSSVRPRIPRRALAAVLNRSPPSAEKSALLRNHALLLPIPPPSPAGPRDADTPRASPASEHRSAESTVSLPGHGGVHPRAVTRRLSPLDAALTKTGGGV